VCLPACRACQEIATYRVDLGVWHLPAHGGCVSTLFGRGRTRLASSGQFCAAVAVTRYAARYGRPGCFGRSAGSSTRSDAFDVMLAAGSNIAPRLRPKPLICGQRLAKATGRQRYRPLVRRRHADEFESCRCRSMIGMYHQTRNCSGYSALHAGRWCAARAPRRFLRWRRVRARRRRRQGLDISALTQPPVRRRYWRPGGVSRAARTAPSRHGCADSQQRLDHRRESWPLNHQSASLPK
jgi:hypothetical protein